MKSQRRIVGLLLVGAMSAAGFVAVGLPASAANGAYRTIVNSGSQKCAGLNPFEYFNNGASVVQQTCNGQPEQNWAPVYLGGGNYQMVNQRSGMCLDVRDGVNADATQVQQWTCTNTPGMSWQVPGNFPKLTRGMVVSKIGSRCLDVRAGSLEDGAIIQIYHCTFSNNAQLWRFKV